jgi:P pilus assembly chaperone PapD
VESGLKATLRILNDWVTATLINNTCNTANIGGIRFLYESVKKEFSLSVHNPDDKANLTRLIIAGTLYQDKESLRRLCVKAIPSASWENNTQQIAVFTSTKLINRSGALKEAHSDKQIDKLNWHATGERLEGLFNEAFSDGKMGAIDTASAVGTPTLQTHTRALSMGAGDTPRKISPVITMSSAYH